MATTFLGTPLKHVAPAAGNGSRQLTKAAIEYYGPNRPLWLGLKLSKNTVPSYLKGEYPGDYGWDTMRLSADPETFKRYREAEVIHARWAMLGTVGCVFPELLSSTRGIDVGEPLWWKAGAQVYSEGGLTYFGLLHITPVSMSGIVAAQVLLMGLAEAYRNNGGPLGTGLDKVYPGGAFDPLGFGDDPDTLAELKVKEIKNGRLAMFSMLGYYAQAICTGKSPGQNWSEHVAAPFDVNGFNISTKFTPQ